MGTTYSKPHRSRGRSWFLWETGSDGLTVPVMVTGPDDQSYHESPAYDARCSLCWLGYAHSGDIHRSRVAETARRTTGEES